MSKVTVIQSITVGQNLQRTYTLGEEVNGRVVIEIKDVSVEWENGIDFKYQVKDEDGYNIASIENMPVIVEHMTIVVDGPVE
jgi:hypothetical protein